MINLPDKIKNDLSGNLTTAEYLVAIKTDPVIYISTTKQMFGAAESEPAYGGNLTNDPSLSFEDSWGGAGNSGLVIEDDGSGNNNVAKWLGNGYVHLTQDILEVGASYRITLDCPFNDQAKIGINQNEGNNFNTYNIVPINQTGTFTTEFKADTSTVLRIYANDNMNADGSSAYSQEIHIDNIFVEKLGIQPVYYEDLDLRVSNIKEKIDLKTKKIQLSSMSLSFNNFPINDVRLSDRMGNGLGKEISVYLKTASCQSIEDCVKVADLKINRYSHDKNAVKISADDKWVESFYIDLPKTLLEKDVNTFEAYNLKPVPILYGHLENAPALPYYDEGEDYSFSEDGIKIIPDSCYLEPNIEIQGIKTWNELTSNGELRTTEQMIDPNIFKIRLSDTTLASIPIRPFHNTRHEIKDSLHTYSQYQTYQDYINILVKPSTFSASTPDGSLIPENTNLMGLWCFHESNSIAYDYKGYVVLSAKNDAGIRTNFYRQDSTNNESKTFFNLSSGYLFSINQTANDPEMFAHNIGILNIEFEMTSGIDLYEDENTEEVIISDVSIVGNCISEYMNTAIPESVMGDRTFDDFRMYTIFSPYKHNDDSAIEDGNGIFWNSLGENDLNLPEISGTAIDFNLATPKNWNFASDATFTRNNNFFRSQCRNHFSIKGLSGETLTKQYINYLSSGFDQSDDSFPFNSYRSIYSGSFSDYPIVNSSNVAIYHTIDKDGVENRDEGGGTASGEALAKPTSLIDIQTDWSDVKLRKYWKNKDIFEKDFFVNAKGRVGSTVNNSIDVEAEIKVFYEGSESPSDFTSNENKHLIELYKALTDSSMKYKNINGEVYELMIYHKILGSEREHYLYNIDGHNFEARADINSLDDFGSLFTDNDGVVQPYYGWIFEVTAKNFGGSHLPNSQSWTNEDVSFFGGFNLIYGKINYSNGDIDSIAVSVDESLNQFNSSNSFQNMNATGKSYVKIYHDSDDVSKKLLESPEDIIGNLVTTEMTAGSVIMPAQETNMKFGFSINKQESSKDIIENICSQSNLFFRYSPRDGQAIIDTIKRVYTDDDIDKTIQSDRILKYSFSKTKIDDLCFGGCEVKWGYDYGKEELANITNIDDAKVQNFPEVDGVQYNYLDMYLEEYGVQDADKYKLEVEAPYINNEATAKKLADYMFHFYRNTHLTIKMTLAIQDGIELEVGDIVNFNSDIGGLKPYGRSIMSKYTLIDQDIYPYFIITSASKTLDKVDLEVMQLHRLEYQYQPPVEEEVDEEIVDPPIDEGGTAPPIDEEEETTPELSINELYSLFFNHETGQQTPICIAGLTNLFLNSEIVGEYDNLTWSYIAYNNSNQPTDVEEITTNIDAANSGNNINFSTFIPEYCAGWGFQFFLRASQGTNEVFAQIEPFRAIDPQELEGQVLGDATQDGSFNVQDVVATVNHVMGNSQLEGTGLANADINSDGIVDILDIIAMMNLIVGDD